MMTVADLIARLGDLDPKLTAVRDEDGVLVNVTDAYVIHGDGPDVVVIE